MVLFTLISSHVIIILKQVGSAIKEPFRSANLVVPIEGFEKWKNNKNLE